MTAIQAVHMCCGEAEQDVYIGLSPRVYDCTIAPNDISQSLLD